MVETEKENTVRGEHEVLPSPKSWLTASKSKLPSLSQAQYQVRPWGNRDENNSVSAQRDTLCHSRVMQSRGYNYFSYAEIRYTE